MSADVTRPFHSTHPVTEYHPIDEIRPGDIVKLGGNIRKVRYVSRTPDDAVRFITLAKIRRSRYDHPTTTITRNEVLHGSYRFGGILGHMELCSTPLECAVQRAAEDKAGSYPSQNLTVGVVP